MLSNKDNHTLSVTTGTIVRVVLVLIAFYFLYYIRDIAIVILTAIVIASAVEPGAKWFTSRRIPRILAVLIIYIAVAVLLASLFYFFLIPLIRDSADFLRTLPDYSASVAEPVVTGIASTAIQSSDFLQGFSQSLSIPSIINSLNSILSNISTGFFGAINVVFGGVMSFFLIVIISFYLAVQEDGVAKFLRIVTPLKKEPYVIDLWNRSKIKIGLWMQGQLLLSVIMSVLIFLGLTLLGVRNTLLLAFIAGVFEIIPLFGAFLAATPAVLIAFIDGGFTFALVVVGLFIIIQQFESHLIYPLVVKKVVGVPPIISIIALIIGFKLAGFLGVLLAVPLAAVLMELLNDMEKSKGREVISS